MAASARFRLLLVLVPVLFAALSGGGALRSVRDRIGDLLFSPRQAPSGIAIIAIDEQSINAIGQWPWPRAVFASALTRLREAAAVAVDVNFKEPSRLGIADDQAFAQALSASSAPVVLASEVQQDGTVIMPLEMLARPSAEGLANLTIDPDGIARSVRLERGGLPSLAAELVHTAGRTAPRSDAPVRINYFGPAETLPVYPFIDLIRGTVPAAALRDTIVLIGATARDLQDYQNTPFGLMSGVEIQATIAANILADDFLKTLPEADTLLVFGAGLAGLAVAWYVRRVWLMVAALAVLLAATWVGVFMAFASGILMDLVMPTAAIVGSAACAVLVRYTAAAHERGFIHETFSRYLAPQVIAELLRDPSKVRLGGERRELTILFSDIRGFTTLSETMPPGDLAHFLNRYLGVMTDIILEHRGVVDKYIGDAIMAFWGAPLKDSWHSLNAVLSALAMVEALERFNRESADRGIAPIAVGIGINTGPATVGNMGSEKRFDYTVIGDEVNLASRLEGLTKTYRVAIIVSGNVLDRIAPADRRTLATREIDRVRVKGKTQPVTLHEVMSPPVAERLKSHPGLFAAGLEHYYAGRWTEAIAAFDGFLTAVGDDGPAQLLKERCQGFLHRPVQGWDGVFEMQHK